MRQTSEQKPKLYGVFATALGVLSLLGTTSCAEDRDRGDEAAARVGTLGLQLQLAPDVVLDTIDYEITGAGFTRTGSFSVAGTGTTFTATITDIPVGQGYRLRLTSRARGDAGIACAGEAVFDVAQSATTQVNVTLLCDALDTSGAAAINGEFNVCPAVTSTTVTPTVQTVGGTVALGLVARDIDRAPGPLSYSWSAASGTLANPTSASPTFTCTAPGVVSIQYAVSDSSCSRGGALQVACSGAADAGASSIDGGASGDAGTTSSVVINEVESNGGVPGDWIELYNRSGAPVDVSGWVVKDNDDTRTFAIASGTVVPAGGYVVVEEAQFGYGLGGGDAARLYRADGTTLVDSYVWTAHATSTYGRCPNGAGAFQQTPSTKGVVNDCSPPDAGVDAGSPSDGGVVVVPTVVINEVESNGGTPGDWAELYNTGTQPADVSNFLLKDNDDTRTFRIAAGSVIPPGGYLVVEEAQFGYGLGAADATRLYAADGVTLVDGYNWTAHATSTYGRCPNGSGAFQQTLSTKGAVNDCSAPDAGVDAGPPSDGGVVVIPTVVINEVESNGGTPGDWAELYNTGTQPADVSNFLLKDNDDTRTFRIAAGSVIPPGGYLVVEEAQFGYGLGAADATRLYAADGVTLVDGYNWTAHAVSTYGRCPNGSGAFQQTLSTKGAVNDCSAAGDAGVVDAGVDAGGAGQPWPGASTVVEVDALNAFPSNLSGLAYQAGATSASSVLWGVQNDPSKIYRLQPNGALWTSPTAGEWSAGKQIFYPTGAGRPDSEGIVFVPGAVAGTSFLYVASERDNGANTVSRLAILMFDPNAAGTTLTAQREWVLTSDLPAVGPNLGLEGIAFISDAELTAQGFREGDGQPYNQSRFAQNGGGIFLVGVEGTGAIHAYALDHTSGTFLRIATFSSGMPGVMDLMYDPDTNYLWAYGDDTVGNKAVLFEIEPNVASLSRGQFVQRRAFQRPGGLPNVNNEGITFAPDSECTASARSFFWADDANTAGHALRRGSIPCGRTY